MPNEASQPAGLMPESRERRMQELRLLANYTMHLQPSMVAILATNQRGRSAAWVERILGLTVGCDTALNAILAYSAAHMLWLEPNRRSVLEARNAYLAAATRARSTVTQTCVADGRLTREGVDSLCLASIAMLVTAFALLGEAGRAARYEPPTQWLELGHDAEVMI